MDSRRNSIVADRLLRWSHDGGQTWSSDVVLTTHGWSHRVRFADDQHGLVVDLIAQDRLDAHYTTTGGQTEADWTATTIAPWTGWFGNQFSLLPNLRARVSGIHYCDSLDGGAGAELDACDHSDPSPGYPSIQVWCAGYNSSFVGKVYTLKLSASSG